MKEQYIRERQLKHLHYGRIITWIATVVMMIWSVILIFFIIGVPMIFLTLGMFKSQMTTYDIMEELIFEKMEAERES